MIMVRSSLAGTSNEQRDSINKRPGFDFGAAVPWHVTGRWKLGLHFWQPSCRNDQGTITGMTATREGASRDLMCSFATLFMKRRRGSF